MSDVENKIRPLIEAQGLHLYDTEVVGENKRAIFRVYITKQGGVTLDECVEVTHLLNPLLDVTPPVSGEYTLEVSSPGLERKLKTLDHIQSSIDELVSFTMIDGTVYRGKLLSVEDELITIEDEGLEDKVAFAYNEVIKAKTYINW
jgi:ribosome maturation factor RimP